ncbi:MAG: hypothetical protein NC094_09630 [Bacteroidales bacterium]|nr:hypothetical protein [Lachnoclostridium sp.]MCM1384107.1 hypothetical protein [Lachnoclostridium sp.]MCM1465667.1 hypothetical protein [Bacteroidales bacterium]
MKNFSKLLALGVAMSLTFGMTAFAAESPSASSSANPSVTNATLEAVADAVSPRTENVTVEAATVESFDTAASAVAANVATDAGKDKIAEKLAEAGAGEVEVTKATVVTVIVLEGTAPSDGKVELGTVPNVTYGKNYVALHMLATGGSEFLPITVASDGSVTIHGVTSFSDWAVVEVEATAKNTGSEDEDEDSDDDSAAPAVTSTGAPASPKTGETLPVAGIAMMIALAGAAVCATKVRYNN